MFELACTQCQWRSADADISACPHCGQTITVAYPASDKRSRDLPGIWRYADSLPLHDVRHAVSLGEGQTPLLRSAHLGMELGLPELYFKMESLNPTGSYKDRIAAVGMSRLRELGKQVWAATSSGNAGAAYAAYSARAGAQGYLFTLEKAVHAKLAQILAYGPTVLAVKGLGYDVDAEQATWRNLRRLCDARDWMLLVTARAFSPHAMEGAKTIAFEVCEQLADTAPDVVYVPVGGGGLLSSTWKGFVEWQSCPARSKIVAVQACGCDPVTQAWEAGRATVQPIAQCNSQISGIQLTAPPDGDLALQAVRESGGWAVSVPDEETYRVQAQLAGREGVFVEPAAAITLAAVRTDLVQGRLTGQERVVCLMTGTGFKDADAVQRMTADRSIQVITPGEILDVG